VRLDQQLWLLTSLKRLTAGTRLTTITSSLSQSTFIAGARHPYALSVLLLLLRGLLWLLLWLLLGLVMCMLLRLRLWLL
jgi:hypothetical protein